MYATFGGKNFIKHDFTTFDIFCKWSFEMMNGHMADDNWSFSFEKKKIFRYM